MPLLLGGDQFAQVVGAAQRVQHIFEIAIRRPVVVHRHPAELAQHASGDHRLHPALAMRGQ